MTKVRICSLIVLLINFCTLKRFKMKRSMRHNNTFKRLPLKVCNIVIMKKRSHSSVIFVESSLYREDNLPGTCKYILKRSHTSVMFVESSLLNREDNLPRTCKYILKWSHTSVMFVYLETSRLKVFNVVIMTFSWCIL